MMTGSTVISKADSSVTKMLERRGRDRCACCGRSTLPMLEWRGDHALCHRCARQCAVEHGEYTHAPRRRFDWASVDRRWAVDLGFKRLA
jgi:hypothetical protein